MNQIKQFPMDGNKLVMVVDDEITARMVAEKALRSFGFEVILADDGIKALEILDEITPSIILLDVEMDNMNGFDTCRHIRQRAEHNDTPVIMLTAHDDPESINSAYRVGANDFAVKPINWALLRHRLRYIKRSCELVSELATAQRLSATGSWRWSEETGFSRWSESLRQLYGMNLNTKAEMLEHTVAADRNLLETGLQNALHGSPMNIIHKVTTVDGATRIVQHRAEPVLSHTGEPIGLIGTVHDVTEREQAMERIHELAYSDDITALPNRRAFQSKLNEAIEQAKHTKLKLGVIYLDLDDFKLINDTLGHSIGDNLLKKIAESITKSLSDLPVYIARLGGDEFAVLMHSLEDTDILLTSAERILHQLKQPVVIAPHKLITTPSIGIAIYPDHATSSEILLKNADMAMFEAKRHGKNHIQTYVSTLTDYAQKQLLIETHLRTALEQNEFTVHYQPQMGVRSANIVGVEALLRWNNKELGQVTPFEFIPVAEKTGLITSIGEWVLKTACAQFVEWQKSDLVVPRMAVNISARQFVNPDFIQSVKNVLESTTIQPENLELELTESMLASDANGAIEKLTELKKLGISLSIDDFGTGYSSLSYLKQFPIDRLKIDRSFVKDIDHDISDMAITKSIIGVANGLSLGVVAEGVETDKHLSKLLELNCEEAQGYLFTEPLANLEFIEWYRMYFQGFNKVA